MFIKQGAVQAFDEAVALRSADLGGAMFDSLQLQEELVRMPIRAPAELSAIIGKDRGNFGAMLFEKRQNVLIKKMHGGNRQLGGIKPSPGITDHGLDGAGYVQEWLSQQSRRPGWDAGL